MGKFSDIFLTERTADGKPPVHLEEPVIKHSKSDDKRSERRPEHEDKPGAIIHFPARKGSERTAIVRRTGGKVDGDKKYVVHHLGHDGNHDDEHSHYHTDSKKDAISHAVSHIRKYSDSIKEMFEEDLVEAQFEFILNEDTNEHGEEYKSHRTTKTGRNFHTDMDSAHKINKLKHGDHADIHVIHYHEGGLKKLPVKAHRVGNAVHLHSQSGMHIDTIHHT